MNQYYYLGQNNQQFGPVPADQLAAKGVQADSLVWCSGMSGWEPASKVKELAPFFCTPPNPPVPPAPHVNQGANCAPNFNNAPQRPVNFLPWAIVSTILCCVPLGIVGIVFASKANREWNLGNYNEACEAAKKAKIWTIVAAGSGLLFSILYILFVIVASL